LQLCRSSPAALFIFVFILANCLQLCRSSPALAGYYFNPLLHIQNQSTSEDEDKDGCKRQATSEDEDKD